ncbi:Lsr2 family protein [Williamsia sp. CHRR-6]|uniref:histone-like nucleoid-structuring protein Lsr2 n=1 Tax=Williamsia sp. CHRR-6 TaxID=2835871 RepID=UPI001BDA96B1|nr:Lsr2 family protein [Williamsia sp. CHRR-6]MBT0566130.1 Lsr2 family protein [Williamsia sp. CHRR-6]
MAKKVTVTIVDDTDESKSADETVEFGLDGVTYEIDLSTDNAEKLRGQLEEWIESARRVGGRRRGKAAAAAAPANDTAAIREWARENGYEVSARGRVSAEIVDLYNQAH